MRKAGKEMYTNDIDGRGGGNGVEQLKGTRMREKGDGWWRWRLVKDGGDE